MADRFEKIVAAAAKEGMCSFVVVVLLCDELKRWH